jgi:hypothetical protein
MEDNNSTPGAVAPSESQGQVTDSEVDSSSDDNTGDESTSDAAQLLAQAKNGTPTEKKEAKKQLRQLQLKIDGQEERFDLPFGIDEEHAEWMTKQMQLSKVSQKRMQESKALESQVQTFVKALKGDTKNVLAQMGIDPREFAAHIIEEEMKLQALSPEQRERQQLEQKLKALEEERRKEKEEFSKKELERQTQQEYEKIDTKMTTAIEKSGLPKSAVVVKKMADYMLLGLQAGVTLEPEDVIDLVKEEMHTDFKALIASLGEDQAEAFIGKDVLNKIRKKNISKAKTTPATAKGSLKDVGSKPVEKEPEKISMKKFFGGF